MKFRVVENTNERLDEIYSDFKQDYLNGNLTVEELKKKYEIGKATYKDLKGRVTEETSVTRKPQREYYLNTLITPLKYIRKNNSKFTVCKSVNKHMMNYGTYEKLETAQKVRNILIDNNWNEELGIKLQNEYATENSKKRLAVYLRKLNDFKRLSDDNISEEEIIRVLRISKPQFHSLKRLNDNGVSI